MKEYKEIKSRDGRTYYLNEDDTVQFITGKSGRAFPYIYDKNIIVQQVAKEDINTNI